MTPDRTRKVIGAVCLHTYNGIGAHFGDVQFRRRTIVIRTREALRFWSRGFAVSPSGLLGGNPLKHIPYALVLLMFVRACPCACADDWPTYRHDNARSGVTAEALRPPLYLCWVYKPLHPPVPSWPHPKRERPRVRFDDAFHVALAHGCVYVGSSADGKVVALDAATGRVKWQFITGGAVRLAPTVSGARVYFGSDDGFIYCLSAETGELLWQVRAALEKRQVIGHGRMISIQPPRAGVLVDKGVAYFACGIFPTEGVGLFAVNARNGKPIWRNDTFGHVYQRMAHGGTEGFSGVSPQGYLLASPERLYVPCGRSVPAAFDRRDGRLLFWHGATHHEGGTWALLAGDTLYSDAERLLPPNAGAAYYNGAKTPPIDGTRLFYDSPRLIARNGATGRDRFVAYAGDRIVVTADTSYVQKRGSVVAIDRKRYAELGAQDNSLARKLMSNFWRNYKRSLDRRVLLRRQRSLKKQDKDLGPADQATLANAQEVLRPGIAEREDLESRMRNVKKRIEDLVKWRCECECGADMILAGNVVYAGGEGKVVGIDAAIGEIVWRGEIDGTARGLAVSDGRLVVSSDNGSLYCFSRSAPESPTMVRQTANGDPYPRDESTRFYETLADAMVRRAGVRRGICLVYGCGEGRLLHKLLRRTELRVYGYDPDAQKVAIAREALEEAGLLGLRANVFRADLSRLPCSDYVANLIVSDTIAADGRLVGSAQEVFRLLRPCGGVALIGQPPGARRSLRVQSLRQWLDGQANVELDETNGVWAKVERGPLPGAGDWTHQYADPGNSGCSMDALVRAPFSILWFGRPGMARVVDRHARAASPLYAKGRLFHQGINYVWGIDAYNGLILWERKIPGAMRTGLSSTSSNMCAISDTLFVCIGQKCLALDGETGKTVREYACPKIARGDRWGWIATEGGRLFGSSARSAHESDALFAVDLETGRRLWSHRTGNVRHCAIALADGRVMFLDARLSPEEKARVRTTLTEEPGEDPRPPVRLPSQPYYPKGKVVRDIRALVALDANTGERLWRVPMDLTGMGKEPTVICAKGVVLVAANMDASRLMALSGENGRILWEKKTTYFRRPVIIGETVYTLPYAHDLRTGKLVARANPITGEQTPFVWTKAYGCGAMSASNHTMFFRSGSLGYYDLASDMGVGNLGGLKPNCWISQIPAGGLWLAPEGSAGCTCAYPIRSTVALIPNPKRMDHWSCYVAGVPVRPVKHLALNLGAPGDRRDSRGRAWFAWPRPKSFFGLKLDVKVDMLEGVGYFERNAATTRIEGTTDPWIYCTGCVGVSRCVLPLLEKEQKPVRYMVRLHFIEPEANRPGRRVFDIKLQGQTVATGFDVFATAGAGWKPVVKELGNIKVTRDLVVELIALAENPAPDQAPILCGIEAVRMSP